jgi:hypothetical protein
VRCSSRVRMKIGSAPMTANRSRLKRSQVGRPMLYTPVEASIRRSCPASVHERHVAAIFQLERDRSFHRHGRCGTSPNRLRSIQQEPRGVGTGSPSGVDSTWRRSLNAGAAASARSLYSHRRALGLLPSTLMKGVPVGEPEHRRAFALAPGGDSGAVPTAMTIRAVQNGRSRRTSAQIPCTE